MKFRIEIAAVRAVDRASPVSLMRSRFAIEAGHAAAVASLGVLVACGGGPSRPPGDTEGPLECTPASPCLTLQQEIEAQCNGGATVRTGMLAGLTVLKVETDPTSYVFTSFTRYYDASGRLVGRTSFVSEYASRSREGTVPSGAPLGLVDACPARP